MSSAFRTYWNSAAGPKTIHFWAPAWKWALVIAGLFEAQRPPETVSAPQAAALTATGVIWSRYATQIIPKNYSLLTVNIFVAGTGMYQLYRRYGAYRDGKVKSFW